MDLRKMVCNYLNCCKDQEIELNEKYWNLSNQYEKLYGANTGLTKKLEAQTKENIILNTIKSEALEQLKLCKQAYQNPTNVPEASIKYQRNVWIGEPIGWVTKPISVRNYITVNDDDIIQQIKSENLFFSNLVDINIIIPKIYHAAKEKYKYKFDDCYGFKENWWFPFELETALKKNLGGDCIALYEEIHVKGGLKKVGDLKVGDMVLSYDWSKKEYCYKPITKIWEKGKLPIKHVFFRNGQKVDVTHDHPFWTRTNVNSVESKYEKTLLKDIDLTRYWKRKIPTAKKLPYEIQDVSWFNEELCFVTGHFIAEGWKDEKHVCTSGYDVPDEIIPKLEQNNIPYSEFSNNSGVPCLRFLSSDFKDFLKILKENSFDIHLPEMIFHLPKKKLQAFLDGYFLGDGHYRGAYFNSPTVTQDYSTSSEQLANDLCRIHLQLGKPLYCWKQNQHKGKGIQPIWRLRFNENSYFNQHHGYSELSEVSISYLEDAGETIVRDFEVADTHTFFLKNGACLHQCEDFAHKIVSWMRAARIPADRIFVSCGVTRSGFGHSTVYVKDSTEEWRHLNSTSPHYNRNNLQDFPSKNDSTDNIGIHPEKFWFSFNDKISISKFETEEAKKFFDKEKAMKRIVIQ